MHFSTFILLLTFYSIFPYIIYIYCVRGWYTVFSSIQCVTRVVLIVLVFMTSRENAVGALSLLIQGKMCRYKQAEYQLEMELQLEWWSSVFVPQHIIRARSGVGTIMLITNGLLNMGTKPVTRHWCCYFCSQVLVRNSAVKILYICPILFCALSIRCA